MFQVGEVRFKREGVKIEEDKVFMRLQTILVPSSTLAAMSLVIFIHCSKVITPLLGGVNIFSVDLSEIEVVGTDE